MFLKFTKLLVFFALAFYLFKWLFLWLFETSDSYFYWAFADFLRTGKYFAPNPYYWIFPTTFAAPFYSFFLYLLRQFLPVRTEIGIHLIQNLSLITSAYLLYQILKKIISKEMALIIASLYLLLPANIFISSGIMPEPLAILAVAFYCYLSFKIFIEKKIHLLKDLLLFSSVIILLRYNFISLFALVFFLICWLNIKRLKGVILADCIFTTVSILIILSWVAVNYKLTGTFGLSDQTGKNLYGRVLGGDKLLPPANHSNWLKLQELTAGRVGLLKPTYDIEPYILSYFNNNVAAESQFFASIALAAIRAHPFEYIKNTLVNFFIIHGNGPPYSIDLYTYGWLGRTCRTLDTITICKPIIESKFATPIWNFLVWWGEKYYATFPVFFNFFLLFPAVLFALFQKNTFIKFIALTYLIAAITAVIPEVPVYRYIYPLYPIKIILTVFFWHTILMLFKRNH